LSRSLTFDGSTPLFFRLFHGILQSFDRWPYLGAAKVKIPGRAGGWVAGSCSCWCYWWWWWW
jgi:hypothetical protein